MQFTPVDTSSQIWGGIPTSCIDFRSYKWSGFTFFYYLLCRFCCQTTHIWINDDTGSFQTDSWEDDGDYNKIPLAKLISVCSEWHPIQLQPIWLPHNSTGLIKVSYHPLCWNSACLSAFMEPPPPTKWQHATAIARFPPLHLHLISRGGFC